MPISSWVTLRGRWLMPVVSSSFLVSWRSSSAAQTVDNAKIASDTTPMTITFQ